MLNWRFLFSIANAAGGKWPETIKAIVETFGRPNPDASNVDRRGILSAIKSVLTAIPPGLPYIHTVDLCKRLSEVDSFRDAKNFKGLSAKQAGWALKRALQEFTELPPPKKVRIGTDNLQGYETAPFRDMFARYNIKTSDEEDDE